MKKTLSSMLIVSAISVSSMSSAIADTTGNLRFTGAVGSTTCTVQNLDQAVSFANLNVSEVAPIANGADLEVLRINYNVSGCPNSITNAKLTVDYNNMGGSRPDMGNTTMRGAAITFKKSTQTGGGGFMLPGYDEDFVINNGTGVVTFTPHLIRVTGSYNGALQPEPGTFTATADLVLAFN